MFFLRIVSSFLLTMTNSAKRDSADLRFLRHLGSKKLLGQLLYNKT
jgi:hypothetical protein